MADFQDGYDSYYANRLWQLLPGVYRARDRDDPAVTGPLEELVARIGAQVAVVRRSIDRLWADQSIESCDDWVIPYLGDLLGTTLINGLDARGQRLDVAKTIHYRRRKGTLAVLEEIARDVTGWQAHVVESFRRLSRTRHRLDPPVGAGGLGAALAASDSGVGSGGAMTDARELLQHEALAGSLTGTPAGGFADLRSRHGADLCDSPFDEFFHTADLRRGQGAAGRFGIPKLLVYLWRLQSFAVVGGTPVAVSGCPNAYVFDPTGRRVPLFLGPLAPEPDDWVDRWTSATEWQVPGPLSSSLAQAIADAGSAAPRHPAYPEVTTVPSFYGVTAGAPSQPAAIAKCWPEFGQVELTSTPVGSVVASYQYGFSAPIGAGPYDRTLLADPPQVVAPEQPPVSGGAGLDAALAAANTGEASTGTVTIADSRTYPAVTDAGSTNTPIGSLLVRAGGGVRPVVRLAASAQDGDPPSAWVFTGGGPDSELVLDGLLVTGGDVVLRGGFASVRLTGCTLDPGTLDSASGELATSVDGRSLSPARIWIEADANASADAPAAIAQLTIDGCVLGPIRTRNGGAVQALAISDSIVQGVAPATSSELSVLDVADPQLLVTALGSQDPLSTDIYGKLPTALQTSLSSTAGPPSAETLAAIVDALNTLVVNMPKSIDSDAAFAGVVLTPEAAALRAEGSAADHPALNRALLESAYPVPLSPAALALNQGTVTLDRVSVLGRAFVHRLQASDSILADFSIAQDSQDGGVRFCAVSAASLVPRPYRSVTIATGAALFTSGNFGDPGYGQLLETADSAITSAATGQTITAGAETGSELGAFSGQLAAIKERGLMTKYAEYMPLGLTPVVVHVT